MTVDTRDLRVELAFGANLGAEPEVMDWTDVSDRLPPQAITIRRGTADESARLQPATVDIDLYNRDGALTPGNARSPHHPHVVRGVPVRVSIGDDTDVMLALPGQSLARAQTPHHASLAITSHLDVRADVSTSDWNQSASLASRYITSGNNRSWVLAMWFGLIRFYWSEDGTFATLRAVETPVPNAATRFRQAVRVVADTTAGTITFYVADTSDGPWVQAGPTQVIPGGVILHAGTAPLEVGAANIGTLAFSSQAPLSGFVHRVEVRSGVGGTVVADANITGLDAGATGWTDPAGRPWSVIAPAQVIATPRHVRFVGQVAEWSPSWPWGDLSRGDDPGEAMVTVTAAGITRRLTQGAKPLDSVLRRRVMANAGNVLAYWPMEEGSAATAAASPLPGVRTMIVGGQLRFATDDTLAASKPLPNVAGGQPGGWNGTVRAADPLPGEYVVEWFSRLHAPPPSGRFTFMWIRVTGTAGTYELRVTPTNVQFIRRTVDGAGTVLLDAIPTPGFYDMWHYWRFRQAPTGGGSVEWSLTWVPLDGANTIWGVSGTFTGTAGRVNAIHSLFSTAPPDGLSIGHIIVQRGLPLGWLAQAERAYAGERAGHRIVRLCREEGVRIVVAGDLDDTERMGPQLVDTFADLLSEAAAADGGRLSELRDRPGYRYRTRASMYNQPPALTLNATTRSETVDGADVIVSDLAHPFDPVFDDQRLRNDVTAKRPNASEARVVDEQSVSAEGRYDTEVEVNVDTDHQLLQQAAWALTLGTWPGMRYPKVATDLMVAPNKVDEWLDLEDGDRVQLVNLPPQHPVGEVDLIADAAAETIGHGDWRPEITCSPGGPWLVGVLDDDDVAPTVTLARLDSDASWLGADINEDATTFPVIITDGPLWTTDPAQLPLDIDVAGERMTVTGITGTSSPQTFTVVRAVNGIRKAHPFAARLHVADPFRLRF